MHWGIRRFQPYSVKPRGSGKGGKEIGGAKQKAKKEFNKAETDLDNTISKKIDDFYEAVSSYKPTRTSEELDKKCREATVNYTYPDDADDEIINKWVDIQKEVIDKSVWWYNHEPKGKYAKLAYEIIDPVKDIYDKERASISEEFYDAYRKESDLMKRMSLHKKELEKIDDAHNKHSFNRGKNKYNEYRILLSAVLMDLGYPVTQENRERIKEFVYDD